MGEAVFTTVGMISSRWVVFRSIERRTSQSVSGVVIQSLIATINIMNKTVHGVDVTRKPLWDLDDHGRLLWWSSRRFADYKLSAHPCSLLSLSPIVDAIHSVSSFDNSIPPPTSGDMSSELVAQDT